MWIQRNRWWRFHLKYAPAKTAVVPVEKLVLRAVGHLPFTMEGMIRKLRARHPRRFASDEAVATELGAAAKAGHLVNGNGNTYRVPA